ncbi:spore cortex biosynthesis protein YabQ [Hazenella sp. IB182357]|uniref:Spore cortex biosynthesis protein YabQ n=1 Tax=Polycladospora coralii TaxID=2771432 RepID=A0A926N655_9BACL|nr:spore cortex biosynthesis protein YabQ [Polycladospora coralii]MBD1372454.1 spore cortex biosynthesis protein YabQ [Polycladospora coralii]MBS7531776.1 spore cortex biosynthesis protein YabQ [Polycladospora coralii]
MTLYTQFITMVSMLGSGMILGLLLDMYRVVTFRFKIRGWVVSLVDLLYWILASLLVFSVLIWSNWGELRFYIFLAICFGFFSYHRWMSAEVIRILRKILVGLEQIVRFLLQVIYVLIIAPIVWIWNACVKILLFLQKVSIWILKQLLRPIDWLFRPISKRLKPMIVPYTSRLKGWWEKKRKEGDS